MTKPRRILALDLEGTLISNAVSQIPRPGLYPFLVACRDMFERIVMFTAVRETRFREIARTLVATGYAPDWFATIEYVDWHGAQKDLRVIPNADVERVVLLDDHEGYVRDDQRAYWQPVVCFEHPYPATDDELRRILEALRESTRFEVASAKHDGRPG